jgi:stearoyl-CoA desaturase (delta-9 desaturase)
MQEILDRRSVPDGPEGDPAQLQAGGLVQQLSAAALICLPLGGVIYAGVRLWGHGIGWLDLGLAVGMYFFTGYGLAVGFHRMFTHASFRPARALKITLAIAGSMAIEGSLFTWVAQHRRHHAYADRVGDPHSPWRYGTGVWPQFKGLWHAHAGWFFVANPSEPERWIPDLLDDKDLRFVSRTAALWSVLSLLLPFLVGLAVTRTLIGGMLALLWAGAVRVAVLHHVTWGVNSFAHMFGSRPYRTRDRSANVALLSVLSFGDSWHNAHHAYPALARHGVDRWQIDSAAVLIHWFERLGWAEDVKWPQASKIAARRLA